MFSQVFVGVGNFERALAFHRALMPVLGMAERLCDTQRPWCEESVGPREGGGSMWRMAFGDGMAQATAARAKVLRCWP